MENQTPIMPTPEATQSVVNISVPPTEPIKSELPVYEKPKTNSFLTVLLSVLLLISIAIAGFFAFQTQKLVKELTVLQTVPTPEVIVEPVVTTDPTVEWKTYTNTTYKYTFKYPLDWKIEDEDTKLAPTVNTKTVLIFNPKDNPGGTFYTGMRIQYVGMFNDLDNMQKVTVNDIPMYKQDTMHGENYYVNIFDTDQYLYVTGSGGYTSNEETNTNLKKIFSTFKFTN